MSADIIRGEITAVLKSTDNCAAFHCVNTLGIAGSGVALAFSLAFPEMMAQYKQVCADHDRQSLMGKYFVGNVDEGKYVYNLFGQKYISSKTVMLDTEAFKRSIESMVADGKEKGVTTFIAPWKIGCNRAGGDWNVIKAIVESLIPDLLWINPGDRFQSNYRRRR